MTDVVFPDILFVFLLLVNCLLVALSVFFLGMTHLFVHIKNIFSLTLSAPLSLQVVQSDSEEAGGDERT